MCTGCIFGSSGYVLFSRHLKPATWATPLTLAYFLSAKCLRCTREATCVFPIGCRRCFLWQLPFLLAQGSVTRTSFSIGLLMLSVRQLCVLLGDPKCRSCQWAGLVYSWPCYQASFGVGLHHSGTFMWSHLSFVTHALVALPAVRLVTCCSDFAIPSTGFLVSFPPK